MTFQDNITESEMTVDAKHHKHFVARRGEVLHRITDECGGVMISFPRPGVQSDKVVLKGAKDCIEAAKARIEEIIIDLESMVTIECVIPQNLHRTVMGAKGRKVQSITLDYDVQIKFPDKNNTGKTGSMWNFYLFMFSLDRFSPFFDYCLTFTLFSSQTSTTIMKALTVT